jgi:hypothetical protein
VSPRRFLGGLLTASLLAVVVMPAGAQSLRLEDPIRARLLIDEAAGHRVRVPHIAAIDRDDEESDGLLGREFLDRFKVVVDPAAGVVTLVPR